MAESQHTLKLSIALEDFLKAEKSADSLEGKLQKLAQPRKLSLDDAGLRQAKLETLAKELDDVTKRNQRVYEQEQRDDLRRYRERHRAQEKYEAEQQKKADQYRAGQPAAEREKGIQQRVKALRELGIPAEEALTIARKNATLATKKARESVDAVGRAFTLLSEGKWRAAAGSWLTAMLGGGRGAQVAGGFFGGIASSVFLPMGWAIGEAIMGAISNVPREWERSGHFAAAGLTAADRARYSLVYQEERGRWAGAPGGFEPWEKGYKKFQELQIDPDEARRRMNQAYVATGGRNADAAGAAVARMMRHDTPANRSAVMQAIPALREYFADPERWGNLFPANTAGEARLRGHLKGGMMNQEDILRALQETAGGKVDAGQTIRQQVESDVQSTSGGLRRLWDQLQRAAAQRFRLFSPSTPEGWKQGARPDNTWWGSGRGFGGAPGLNEPTSDEPYQLHADRFRLSRFQFTSASGLAERMQMMWSGAPGMASTDANTKAIDQNNALTGKNNELLELLNQAMGAEGRAFIENVVP